jgi:hypothetical protein
MKLDVELVKLAAELKFKKRDEDSGAKTMREYLHALLTRMWAEGEGFSGKRPFGNSGWEYDIYRQLVAANLVEGKLDKEGYIDTFDEDFANKLMFRVIDYIMLNK